jgi:hypothetical protein
VAVAKPSLNYRLSQEVQLALNVGSVILKVREVEEVRLQVVASGQGSKVLGLVVAVGQPSQVCRLLPKILAISCVLIVIRSVKEAENFKRLWYCMVA